VKVRERVGGGESCSAVEKYGERDSATMEPAGIGAWAEAGLRLHCTAWVSFLYAAVVEREAAVPSYKVAFMQSECGARCGDRFNEKGFSHSFLIVSLRPKHCTGVKFRPSDRNFK
jgi:hypothetical protein